MCTWEVDVYENTDDQQPTRKAVVNAPTEHEAAEAVANGMGDAQRADLKPVIRANKLPQGQVIWIP